MTISHPYMVAPDKAFWSKAVATGWLPADLIKGEQPLVYEKEKVMSAGSCFAANMIPYLENAGFHYLRTERPHPAFARSASEFLSYDKFSAQYGNIYTARQLRQLLERSLGIFQPVEDRWLGFDGIIDPFRPGLRFKARSNPEFDLLQKQHLACVRAAFESANVLIYTLGLTEAWMSTIDGAIFPACPGTVAGKFDAERHTFHNFSAIETTQDLQGFVELFHSINSSARVILTVSPVPLVATATSEHVLAATSYSKAVLRVAAHDIALRYPNVRYFPAYELVTGPQMVGKSFDATLRNVTPEAIEMVMSAFFANCEFPANNKERGDDLQLDTAGQSSSAAMLARELIAAECEEEFADQR